MKDFIMLHCSLTCVVHILDLVYLPLQFWIVEYINSRQSIENGELLISACFSLTDGPISEGQEVYNL